LVMNGSGTAVICLFNALEARREDAGYVPDMGLRP
jgi:hypothetical protein